MNCLMPLVVLQQGQQVKKDDSLVTEFRPKNNTIKTVLAILFKIYFVLYFNRLNSHSDHRLDRTTKSIGELFRTSLALGTVTTKWNIVHALELFSTPLSNAGADPDAR